MLDFDVLKKEYEEIGQRLINPSLDQNTRVDLQKRSSKLSMVLEAHDLVSTLKAQLDENKKLGEQDDFKELALEENNRIEKELTEAQRALDELLYPANEQDDRSVFMEIRAGAGGQEAALFVSDLFKMYNNYALARHWAVSVVDVSETDLGGCKELILHIKGKGVYRFLKFESGVHRVQRVPSTEGAGRIHTSTVTVAVLPEVDDVEVNINPQDLRIDVYRAQGAGGQHVNKTDSAVRIIHIPSGIMVTCQDERSQIKNKAKALKVLQSRLFEMERQKREAAISEQRKQQVGMGERAEKIRTYNYPQNRVTDHRIELTLKKLDMVVQGDLDDLITPLLEWDVNQRREALTI